MPSIRTTLSGIRTQGTVSVFINGVLLLGLAVLGCAPADTGPKPFDLDSLVVYPSPPDSARIQFLRSYSGSQDLQMKTSSGFADWLLGAEAKQIHVIRKADGVGAWDGKLYVVDQRAGVLFIFDLRAQELKIIGQLGPGRLEKPRALHIDADGNKYVADMGRKQVVVFDPQDEFMTAYGLEDPSAPFTPIAAAPLGNELFVVDIANHRIAVFDLTTARLTRTIGQQGSEPGQFVFPYDLSVIDDKYLLVTDFLNTRVQQIDTTGKAIKVIGSLGIRHGEFVRPKGIAIGPDGIFYVVDAATEVVQMFNAEGKILMSLGGPGNEPGDLVLPTGVATSADPACIEALKPYIHPDFEAQYLILVANQFGNAKLNVYAFGKFPPGKDPFQGQPLRARSRPASQPIITLPEDAVEPEPTRRPTAKPTKRPESPRVIDPLKLSKPSASPATQPASR